MCYLTSFAIFQVLSLVSLVSCSLSEGEDHTFCLISLSQDSVGHSLVKIYCFFGIMSQILEGDLKCAQSSCPSVFSWCSSVYWVMWTNCLWLLLSHKFVSMDTNF